jgi:hypothetical protein
VSRPAVVVAVVAFALVGCGGGDRLSKEEYEVEMRPIVVGLSSGIDRLHSTLADTARMDEFERELARGRQALRTAAERLEALEPPDDVERVHDGLAEGALQYARELQPLQAAARCRDEEAFQLAEGRRSRAGFIAVSTAIDALRARGYRVPDLALQGVAPPRRPVPDRPLPADCAERT